MNQGTSIFSQILARVCVISKSVLPRTESSSTTRLAHLSRFCSTPDSTRALTLQGCRLGLDLDGTLYALDSSIIDVSLTLFPRAPHERSRAAVKLNTPARCAKRNPHADRRYRRSFRRFTSVGSNCFSNGSSNICASSVSLEPRPNAVKTQIWDGDGDLRSDRHRQKAFCSPAFPVHNFANSLHFTFRENACPYCVSAL